MEFVRGESKQEEADGRFTRYHRHGVPKITKPPALYESYSGVEASRGMGLTYHHGDLDILRFEIGMVASSSEVDASGRERGVQGKKDLSVDKVRFGDGILDR